MLPLGPCKGLASVQALLVFLVVAGWAGPARTSDVPTLLLNQSSDRQSEAGPDNDPERVQPRRVNFDQDQLLFVFGTIADSHVTYKPYDDCRYLKARSISRQLLANYVADINAQVPALDFVVHLGDVTDNGTQSEFREARSILDDLQCPMFPVVGNHDNAQDDGKAGWKEFAGLDSTNYSFDVLDFHFIVIDCILDPYLPPYIGCDDDLRTWVAADLARNSNKPTIVFSHVNLWPRGWNAKFDTTESYQECDGAVELRQVLEAAGNVAAVLNGHVHANRVEIHNGIYYLDIGATLVGPPSIRYFYVLPDSIVVTYAYISDQVLFEHVTGLCGKCTDCFDRTEVCDFIDGGDANKRFVIRGIRDRMLAGRRVAEPDLSLEIRSGERAGFQAFVNSQKDGRMGLSLYNVQGRLIDQYATWKDNGLVRIDLSQCLPAIGSLAQGVYFLSATQNGERRTAKLVILP